MAEHRRIPFETVKPINQEKKTCDSPVSIRFNLSLDESNEKTCPEFSYGELVKSATPDETKAADSDEPFGDNDDEKLRELAKKFEEKYGPKVGNKKRKRMGRWEDYIDRGMGYDETDPFIDNDEAYDELVPSTLTTQFGGFYINSGELEFKNISEDELEGPDGVKRRRRRRRRDMDERDPKKRCFDRDGVPTSRGRGRKPGMDRSASALAKAKRKSQPTVAALLQERKAQLLQSQDFDLQSSPQLVEIQEQQHPPPKEAKKELKEEPLMMAESPLPAPVITSDDDEEPFPDLDQLHSDDKNESNINDIIESVIKNSEDVLNNGNLLTYAGGGSSDGDEVGLTIADVVEAPKMPSNLTAELYELVKKIKQAAITSEQGKCKFFTHEVNKMLLSIEMKTRELSCTQRSMIYSHLASYLPCTKETLLKRAKKLRLDQEGGKLQEPMQRLRDGIGEVLPAMIDKFSQACLAAAEAKNGDEAAVVSDQEGSQGKGLRVPKKKFDWNDHTRELLCEVVRIKLKCYEVSKLRAQSAEDYLQQFLDQEVCKLWPDGWVNTKILLKESRSAHAYVTAVKPKKPLLMVKKPSTGALLQVEGIPAATIAKYSNMPQPMVVQEAQPSADALTVALPSMPSLEEAEEELLNTMKNIQHIQVSSATDDMQMSAGLVGQAASVYLDTATLEQQQAAATSPNKRIFTLMNTEEATQVVEAQKSTTQKSFAATMLDRIICASLADFPNSGTSTQSVTIERTPRPVKAESVHKQLDTAPKNEPVLMKATPHVLADTSKTSTPIYASTPAVSILKSNYQSPTQPQQQTLHHQPPPPQQQQQQQQQSRPNRVLDHMSAMPVSSSISTKQVSPNSVSSSLIRPSHSSSLPMQTYEFQEAFKRSLAVPNSAPNPSNSDPARNYPRKRQVSEESDDQPVNFSNPQSTTHYAASQELNRLASTALGSTPYQSQPVSSTAPTRGPPRSSPESTYTSAYSEGMKGFPLPLKTVVNPPPAHSYPSNRRTSPGTESGFTSPHRHNNSQSPHQMASSAHSPPQSVANHSPYQSTAPLSHFTPPESAHNPRSIIQTSWRNSSTSSTSASSNYTMPSQYSTAGSTSYNMSQSGASMNHNIPGLGPPPGHHFLPAAAPTSGQRNHAKPYTAQQAMQRGAYGQLYPAGTGYPNTGPHGSTSGQFSEGSFGQQSPSQQLNNYHGVSLPSLAGPGSQQGSHTRIP